MKQEWMRILKTDNAIGFLKVASYQVFTREVSLIYLLFVVVVIQKVRFFF